MNSGIAYWNGRQAVCKCPAYSFPHRLGGGACNGYFLAQECFENCIHCARCDLHDTKVCEVMVEITAPRHCPYVIEFCEEYEVKC